MFYITDLYTIYILKKLVCILLIMGTIIINNYSEFLKRVKYLKVVI